MSLGGFRMLWQPLRPFIAGTKLTNYVLMKHGQEEEEKNSPLKNAKMIHVDAALSPPPTPIHLSSPVSLVASSPGLTSCTVTSSAPLLSTPDIEYDGITFTANVANLFSVTPTSPPESEYDDTEVSLFMDEEEEFGKMKMAMAPSSTSGRCSSLGSNDGFIDSDLAEAAILAVRAAPSLATAVSSVLETGSMTPLIKEELKCTIQTKRMRNGKGELKVRSERKKAEELTPEEEARRLRRRERNKLAAQKCRDKKSDQANELQEEIGSLESRNTSLRTEMKHLNKEIEQLRNMLVRHDKSTQCGHSFHAAIKLVDTDSMGGEELALPAAKRQKTKRGAQKHHK